MCGLFWGAHKSLAPRARTLLGGLGQATLSFFAVATLLFVFFGERPKFCDLAKQRRKIVWGVSEVGKDDFSLYFFWRCVVFLVFFFLLLRSRDDPLSECEGNYRYFKVDVETKERARKNPSFLKCDSGGHHSTRGE